MNRYPINIQLEKDDFSSDEEEVSRPSTSTSQDSQPRKQNKKLLSSALNPGPNINPNDLYIDTKGGHVKAKSLNVQTEKDTIRAITQELTKPDLLLEKSVLKPGFEKLESVPPYEETKRKEKMMRQKEREKTKGDKWFNLPATELTEEVKRDLEVIQMRSVLDPKQFYKKNDLKILPKYFQIGTVKEHSIDFYSSRLKKKDRKRTLVDELMADANFQRFNKAKYADIIQEKQRTTGAHRHARRLKNRKK
nr:EOG090X0GO7 [Eulimnadia texana]